ncbi:MAG: MFS transporter [Acidimicrobiales bacterium mtb01]|nr:DHA2 family efflux MFS transporter permease subunit [Actinomycetota bacterium]TEX47394.1 MAG: MFS transporter [Acidimicrobiales bacterium mtb01]
MSNSTALAHPNPAVHARRWWILTILCISVFLVVVDNMIINVAIPTLARDLGASTSGLQWIVDSYALVFAGLLLACGGLGDRFGRKLVMQIGMVLFGAFSAWAAFTNTTGSLITARGLMGVGAALVFPSTLAILIDVFRDPVERAKSIGVWSAVSGSAVAFGPVTGGFLLEHFWWGSVFLINIPIVAVALVLQAVFVPESKDPNAKRLDIPGFLLSISFVTLLVYSIVEAPHRGWTNGLTIAGFIGTAVLVALFIVRERGVEFPLLDVRVFRDMRVTAATVSILITFFSIAGFTFLITQYFQFVRGDDPLTAGLRNVPFAIVFGGTAPVAARLALRYGPKRVVPIGLLLMGLSQLWAATFEVDTYYFGIVIGVTVLMAFGMGLILSPASESVMGSVPREMAGVGSAINDTGREVGATLGVAIIGSIFSSAYGPRIVELLTPVGLPEQAIESAKSSVGAAFGIAEQAGDASTAIRDIASSSFMDGFQVASISLGIVAIAGSLLAWRFLPTRIPQEGQMSSEDLQSIH